MIRKARAHIRQAEPLLAASLLGAVVIAAFLSATTPLRDAFAERREVRGRLTQHELALSTQPLQLETFDPAQLAAIHSDENEALLELQFLIDTHARTSGLTINAVDPAGAEDVPGFGRIVWVEATVAGDLGALTALMENLNTVQPFLIVDELSITSLGGVGAPAPLNIRLRVGSIWRAGEGRR